MPNQSERMRKSLYNFQRTVNRQSAWVQRNPSMHFCRAKVRDGPKGLTFCRDLPIFSLHALFLT